MSLKETDVKTPGDAAIAKKFKLSLAKVRQLVNQGAKHEKEHNTNLAKAKEVARDHIAERPDYYKMLKKAEKTPVSVKEGISAGPERSADYSIGDAGGGRTLYRPLDVKEGAKIEKAKKLAAAGLTAANLYTLGDVTSRAIEGNRTVSAKHDVVKAASALPGPAGYAAAAVNYAKQAYDKVKQMKEENDLKGVCWKGYTAKGLKKKGNRMVPNCVPVSEQGSPANPARYTERPTYEMKEPDNKLSSGEVERGVYEATFQGKKVALNKPMKGDVKKSKVYVDPDGDGKAQKVNFGDPNMTIKKSNPARRKSFRARHNCDNPGPKTKARYWSCRAWEETQIDEISAELVGKVSNARFWRGEAPSKTLSRAVNKKFVESGNKKLVKKETKMDTKDHINEALDNILENNLVDMKENLLAALQEKAMEKLEEKKKEIAANYFAQ